MRKTNNFWMIKIGNKQKPSYIKNRMDWIIEERIKAGKNKVSDIPRDLNYARLLLAAMRDDQTVNKLINADFVKENK